MPNCLQVLKMRNVSNILEFETGIIRMTIKPLIQQLNDFVIECSLKLVNQIELQYSDLTVLYIQCLY